jgi:hypothetical protein
MNVVIMDGKQTQTKLENYENKPYYDRDTPGRKS